MKTIKNNRKYITFNYINAVPGGKTLLTGIRGVRCKPNKVYICGFYEPSPDEPDQMVKSFVYKGRICGHKGEWFELDFPSGPGRTVVVTNLYGPNNGPEKNTIQIVGNYTTEETGNTTIGCLYEGKLDGSGQWTTLIPSFPGDPETKNTIAHSNMGGLVVGNYDTQVDEGKAFIYDIKRGIYHKIVNPNMEVLSITAYGIWYNGCNSYTICGGYKATLESETAYLVDWNNKTKTFSNWRSYHYDNDPIKARITHFDGITGGEECGYNLTGDWLGFDIPGPELGFFATIKRCCKCGKFKRRAKWEDIKFPLENSVTSGNSVYRKVVIGVYTTDVGVNGYVSFPKHH